MDIDKRIITLIELLGLSPGEFADKINVQRSSISHITSARNKPSLDFLERTLSVFPEINSDWLILGKGKPLKNKEEEIDKKKNILKNNIIEQPTLFTTVVDNSESKKNYKSNSYNLVDIDEEKNNVNSKNDSTPKEDLPRFSQLNSKKKINRILFFYEDGTFEVYES
ncbi:XRE family transcriptional regulator [Apibacter muscae]|uniref:helix-turn-helix domain-containing protein n=1 Tax=Apibacter muscae TaxID=2509004 RepID=UPI0011AD94C7|nr:helix-turn-helix transcriptional regulator [Apibacter muscae]TWP22870.1 XRE family transcriptional regulator [Apibacter muscae]TWP28093.1 XRE family transcriptional regulator [Apibacter muscae]